MTLPSSQVCLQVSPVKLRQACYFGHQVSNGLPGWVAGCICHGCFYSSLGNCGKLRETAEGDPLQVRGCMLPAAAPQHPLWLASAFTLKILCTSEHLSPEADILFSRSYLLTFLQRSSLAKFRSFLCNGIFFLHLPSEPLGNGLLFSFLTLLQPSTVSQKLSLQT